MWYLPILFYFYMFQNAIVTGEKHWTGPYFPHRPGDDTSSTPQTNVFSDSLMTTPVKTSNNNWSGAWFPNEPGKERAVPLGRKPNNPPDTKQSINPTSDSNTYTSTTKPMGLVDTKCDNGKDNIQLDYDPNNRTHQLLPMCLNKRDKYKPSAEVDAILQEYRIPTQYSALHRCMNETITYDYRIPTFGTHRLVWPVYGEYNYVPKQRWLHNLEHGAIVALYHPCANKDQISKLKQLIKSCLYRYIITPYEQLDPERPFALVAWGKSLEMPFIDRSYIIAFIRMNALQAPEKVSRDGQYSVDLIEKAQIVSDINDQALCPNM